MTTERNINIGIVGLGGHGRTLQNWISKTDGLNVVSVFDISADERNRSARMFECGAASSFEELLFNDQIQAVVIATPNHLHLEQTNQCLNRRLDVLVEKPIANTVEDAKQMVELAESTDRLLMIGHNMRFNRASRKTKELIESGDFGEVVSVEIHFSANNTPYYAPDSWRLQPEYCPLLPVTQLGIHGIDLVHYFIGRVTSVVASARSVTVAHPIYDSVSALMNTDAGIAVTMASNYCSPVLFECRFAMTDRNIVYTPHSVDITPKKGMQGSDSEWTHFDYHDNTEDGYWEEMKLFQRALASGTRQVEASARGGLQALAVHEALIASIETGQSIDVPNYQVEATST